MPRYDLQDWTDLPSSEFQSDSEGRPVTRAGRALCLQLEWVTEFALQLQQLLE
jgi:hypothetical protein